jgi:hypothetical protein
MSNCKDKNQEGMLDLIKRQHCPTLSVFPSLSSSPLSLEERINLGKGFI